MSDGAELPKSRTSLADEIVNRDDLTTFSLYCPGCGTKICELTTNRVGGFQHQCECGATLQAASTPAAAHRNSRSGDNKPPERVSPTQAQSFLKTEWRSRDREDTNYNGVRGKWIHETLANEIGFTYEL